MMEEPQSSSEHESSAADSSDVQLSQEVMEAEYTTPLKSNNSSQEVPSFPLNSKYETKHPTLETSNSDSETESFNLSPSLTNGSSTLHDDNETHASSLASTETIEEIKEPVTKSNVKNLYDELCELEHLFVEELSLEWFYFIFEGEDVHKIKRVFTDIDMKLSKEMNVVCPEKCNIWKWAQDVGTPNDVKVVIVGQDPSVLYTWNVKVLKYIPMSCGSAFQVSPEYWEKEKTLGESTSIKYIMKIAAPSTADSDSFDGYLRPWTEQGVLLINSSLTTAVHRGENKIDGGQHFDFNWKFVTRLVLEKLGSASQEPTVLMPWGVPANKLLKEAQIDPKHKVIQACHPVWQKYSLEDPPSNCSCGRYCWMSHQGGETEPRNDFKVANEFLEQHGRKGIVWDCFGKKVLLRRKSTNFRENLEKCNGEAAVSRKGLAGTNQHGALRKIDNTKIEKGNETKDREKENVNIENKKVFKRELDESSEEDDCFSRASKKPKSNE